MKSNASTYHRLTGLKRFVLRLPIWLYRLKLGWLLGKRFLLLTHVGRKTGVRRRTVLEVIRYDPVTGVYTVGSGWGEQSQWFRNIKANPNVLVQIGWTQFAAAADILSEAAANETFRDYYRRHPSALRTLGKMMTGIKFSPSDEYFDLLSRSVPLIALRPSS